MLLVESLLKFIKTGERRDVKIKKNIISSFLIRALSISINLLVVSMAINYVDPVQYGIWLTLTSIISWFTYFDFGVGNGLRNRLSTALAFEEYDKARKYVSTAYAAFIIIALTVFSLFFIINPYIDWSGILNVPATIGDIHLILIVLVGTLCVQFVLQLVNAILNAVHEPAKAELITFLGQLGMLITLLILKFTTPGSLKVLIAALNIAPLVTIFCASLVFYNGKYKMIAPSLKNVDRNYARSILNIGGAFFVIQLGSMVLHQTDNIIISRVLGPGAVTTFNVTYKLYFVVFTGFAIITAPYWSAFTDAYAKKDFAWINKSVKRLRDIWLFTSLVIIPVFFILAKFFFKILFPNVSDISSGISATMAVYMACSTCLSFLCSFLYGIAKLRVLLILYVIIIITNVPLGILLGKSLGVEGVILSNIIAYVFMNIILTIQTNKLLQQKATGIWNR